MSNFKRLDPRDVDETLVKLVEFSGRRYVLLPFVDATGSAPEFRSLGHPTKRESIVAEDLVEMSSHMERRALGAIWFILFNTPWLLNRAEADAMRPPRAAR